MNNHQKYRGRILAISNGIFPTQQSTKSTFWMEYFINNQSTKSTFWTKNFQINVLPKQYTLQLTGLSSVGTGGVWREREGKPREFLSGPVGEWRRPSENGAKRKI